MFGPRSALYEDRLLSFSGIRAWWHAGQFRKSVTSTAAKPVTFPAKPVASTVDKPITFTTEPDPPTAAKSITFPAKPVASTAVEDFAMQMASVHGREEAKADRI